MPITGHTEGRNARGYTLTFLTSLFKSMTEYGVKWIYIKKKQKNCYESQESVNVEKRRKKNILEMI